MDNKPIVIDGVDVSNCSDYDEDTYFTCQACEVCKCSELPNCYFKQLARKTQECEELKAENEELKNCIECNPEAKVYKTNLDLAKNDTKVALKLYSKSEQKLKLIRGKVQAYIDDEADLIPEQVIQIIDEVE